MNTTRRSAPTGSRPTTTAEPKPANVNPPGTKPDKPLVPLAERSLVHKFSKKFKIEPDKLVKTLKDTAFKQPGKFNAQDQWVPGPEVTDEQMMALLIVADEYQLNPFLKEIYAFPAKGGGIVPIISIDGWITLINRQPQLASISFAYAEAGTLIQDFWIECIIKRKDREEPVAIVEYYSENFRDTEPWRLMGRRMLRHRALIQCARVAFGLVGVYDPDEGRNVWQGQTVDGESREVPQSSKPLTREPDAKIEGPKPTATPEAKAPEAKPPADLFNDETPMEKLQRRIDQTGVPESEVLAHFEAGSLDQLGPSQVLQALEFVEKVKP